jgi:peptidoglycan/LPS O-acetylase OafA/YrhL
MTDKHLDYLDGWRGLAIVMLLIGHFFPIPGINLGTVGVNLFFVLSGFLMGRLLFVKRVPIPVFYRRRISRILPTHIAFLTVTVLVYSAIDLPIAWREVAAALFFFNNYDVAGTMPFGHIWSLSVEEHSYILLSLVALYCRKYDKDARLPVLLMAALFSLAGFWYWTQFSGRELEFGKWLHTEVSAYGIFISCGLLLWIGKTKIPTLPVFMYPLLILFGLALHWWSVPSPVRTTVGVGVFALTLNLLSAAPSVVKRVLGFKPLVMMGTWSFSIYLWQQPFYLASRNYHLLPEYMAAAIAIGCGIASYYLIENPVRLYLNSNWGTTGKARHEAVRP